MSDFGVLLMLVGVAIGLISFVGIIRPLPRLWLPTRKRAAQVLGASFLMFIIGGMLLPTPEESAAQNEREKKAALEKQKQLAALKERERKAALKIAKEENRKWREAALEEQKWRDTADLARAFFEMGQKDPPKAPSEWYLGLSADEKTTFSEKIGLGKVIRDSFGSELVMAHIRTSSMRHDGVEGHKIVEVTIMGGDNFTPSMIKRGIELDMIDGYEKIFTSGFPIQKVTIKALRPLMD